MSFSVSPQIVVLIVLTPLIAWRMVSRIRRMVGRQTSTPWRQWLTVCVFPLVIGLLGSTAPSPVDAFEMLLGGTVLGTILGIIGHRLTRFEQTDAGLFYTPNAHLGIALSLVFIGRIGFRFVQTALQGGTAPSQPPTSSPLTLAIFGVLAGYYVAYAIGLILWRRNAARAQQIGLQGQ